MKRGQDGTYVVSPPLTSTGSNPWAKKSFTANSEALETLILSKITALPLAEKVGFDIYGEESELFDDKINIEA